MKNINEISEVRTYAAKLHSKVNHTYDGKTYLVHLDMVYEAAKLFIHLVPETLRINVFKACFLHDTIEDCRVTYNDVKKEFGKDVAEIVYVLTNEKGRNREERANLNYYLNIRTTPGASFVKLCDRIANATYSKQSKSRMFDVYKKENEKFIRSVLVSGLEEMADYLTKIFEDGI